MVKGFNTKCQAFCTCWCLLALILCAAGTLLAHIAFGVMVTPLIQLPSNLERGLLEVLKIGELETQSQRVKTSSQNALQKCGILPTVCNNLPPAVLGTTANTATELADVRTVFDTTLSVIESVANDRYLGIADFRTVSADLEAVRANLTSLESVQQPTDCAFTNPLFCTMYQAGDAMVQAAGQVRNGVTQITQQQSIVEYEKASQNAKEGFHGLPYVMWVSMLFYICFFFSARPSCKGGIGPCCACTFHGIFFFLSVVISMVFVAGGILSMKVVANIELGSPFAGQPTIGQLIDHIQTAFPGFYNIVLRDLLDGMKKTYNAYVIFLAGQLLLLVHTCSCCCGVYVPSDKGSS